MLTFFSAHVDERQGIIDPAAILKFLFYWVERENMCCGVDFCEKRSYVFVVKVVVNIILIFSREKTNVKNLRIYLYITFYTSRIQYTFAEIEI